MKKKQFLTYEEQIFSADQWLQRGIIGENRK